MSDSEATDLPSDATLSRALRDVVISTYKSGKTDDLTVKRVRTGAEAQLDLPGGFFKSHGTWSQKSKDIILESVEKYCGDEPASEPKPTPTPKKVPKPKAAPKAAPKTAPKKTKPANDSPRGVKRRAAAPEKKTQKRRKTVVSSDEESDAAPTPPKEETPSDVEDESPPKKLVQRTKKVVADDSEGEGVAGNGAAQQENDDEEPSAVGTPPRQSKGDVSESELSSLVDESPVKKRQKKTGAAQGGKTAAKEPKPKAIPKAKAQDDPDQAEIKRLQGWLVKCGIRKVWSKELANCDSPKEKIKHLKGMLKDAGMDGKYSVEKAARIKEEREFAKDLEAIQEAEQVWGANEAEAGSGRPKRRAAARVATSYVIKRPVLDEDDDDSEEGGDKEESSDGTDDMSEDTGGESDGVSDGNDEDSD